MINKKFRMTKDIEGAAVCEKLDALGEAYHMFLEYEQNGEYTPILTDGQLCGMRGLFREAIEELELLLFNTSSPAGYYQDVKMVEEEEETKKTASQNGRDGS